MKSRVVVIFFCFALAWILVLSRAAYLQFLPNDKLTQLGKRQYQTQVNLPARRGSIFDRKGRDLALTVQVPSLFADPKLIVNPKKVARQLGHIFHEDPKGLLQKINDPTKRFVWIKRLINKTEETRVKDLGIAGLSFVNEWKRVYPNDALGRNILGLVGTDGKGIEGLELEYENELKGSSQKVTIRRDARGRPLMNDGLLFTENKDGSDLRLTIDSEIQYYLESELKNTVRDFNADGAVGIVLDAQTSAVLAVADAQKNENEMKDQATLRRNRALTDAFEPGSVMKTFVIASGIREKMIQPNTKFFCENGSFKVGDRIIKEAESQEKFGNLSVSEILAVSSNIGTTKIAMSLGDQLLADSLGSFGFGEKSGIDFPGESKGIIQQLPWRPHLLANVSFGHGIAATPLQIANAYAAIANGGVLKTPFMVDSIYTPGEGITSADVLKKRHRPERRILTEDQAKQIRIMLTTVTADGGTGVNARVNGFAVAGKTGTAQKVNPHGRGYLTGQYISSFGGFLPANDPRFVIFVAVDSPRTEYYSAKVAAPLFSRIASYCVQQDGIAPTWIADEGTKKYTTEKLISGVTKEKINEKQVSELQSTPGTVPNVLDMSAREIMRQFRDQNIRFRFSGSGQAKLVTPEVGAPIPKNGEVRVILE